ncbi:hypothetical protein ACFQU7_00835 [Pseudoroseomonas wenyumeiae]
MLVLEVRTSVEDFAAAAVRLGFEWLGEMAPGDVTDEDPELAQGDNASSGDAEEAGDRLFVALPTEDALRALLASWRSYTRRESPGENRAWWSLFEYLTDLRSWSPQDRVEAATVDYLQRRLQMAPNQPVRLELDLWFRGTDEARAAAVEQVSLLLQDLGELFWMLSR